MQFLYFYINPCFLYGSCVCYVNTNKGERTLLFARLFSKNASLELKTLRYASYFGVALYASSVVLDYATEADYPEQDQQKLTRIFQGSLDLDKIRFEKSWLTDKIIKALDADAFTLGNTLRMPTRYDTKDQTNLAPWLFLHENVHIWQHQNCNTPAPPQLYAIAHDIIYPYFNDITGEETQNVPYFYKLDEDKDLSDYNREQQASIVADYYRILEGGYPIYLDINQNYKRDMPFYRAVLKNFLEDPSYIRNKCKNILEFNPNN
jgi:hypothetical protein